MEQLLAAQPAQIDFRGSESLDAEERLHTQDALDIPELINGPECYQLPVPNFAETSFRFMGMELDLRNAQSVDLSLQDVEALKCCAVCRTSPCKCRDDVEDECMVCNEIPCVCDQRAGQLVTDGRAWTLHQLCTSNPPWPTEDPRWCDALAEVVLTRRRQPPAYVCDGIARSPALSLSPTCVWASGRQRQHGPRRGGRRW